MARPLAALDDILSVLGGRGGGAATAAADTDSLEGPLRWNHPDAAFEGDPLEEAIAWRGGEG